MSAKLSSDNFLKQWFSNKGDMESSNLQLTRRQTTAQTNTPNDGSNLQTLATPDNVSNTQTVSSYRKAALSKFLTSAAQPKVESKVAVKPVEYTFGDSFTQKNKTTGKKISR